ncbi:MAG: CHRD domain-containing protein [Sphingomonadales bacterium]|nr:CHRD domain-containing protein [Sphingomonadales bacterium]
MPTQTDTPQCRHDGWTPERRVRFLEGLAACGCVRSACASVGMSFQSAYVLRRRDALFAAGWDAALLRARELAEDTLMARALHGVTETVYYRGEAVGSRTRFDPRLLLALLTRLDIRAGEEGADALSANFDALLAQVADGEALAPGEPWSPPPTREEAVHEAAQSAYPDPWARGGCGGSPPTGRQMAARDRKADRLAERAGADWDAAQEDRYARVDAAMGAAPPATPRERKAGRERMEGREREGGSGLPPIEYKSLDGPGKGALRTPSHPSTSRRAGAAGCASRARGAGCAREAGNDTGKGRLSVNRTHTHRSILLAAGALALAASPALAADGAALHATLNGASEVPGPGMDGAMGQASVMAYPDTGYVCWSLSVSGAGEATMAHIHKGAAGVAGGVAVPLEAPGTGASQGCAKVDKAIAADIAANPAGYYVNVHNAQFPKGAIRGQLGM